MTLHTLKQLPAPDKLFWLIVSQSMLIFGMAYSLSFSALYDYATQHGYGPLLATLFAIFVDITLSYAVLSAMYKMLTGRHNHWCSLPIVVYSLFSLLLNIAHSDMTAGGLLIKLVIVVTMFYISETLREHIQFWLSQKTNQTPINVEKMRDGTGYNQLNRPVMKQLKVAETAIKPVSEQSSHDKKELSKKAVEARQQKALKRAYKAHQLQTEGYSLKEIADQLNCSVSSVRRYLNRSPEATLNGQGG